MEKQENGTDDQKGITVDGSKDNEGIIQQDSQDIDRTTGDGTQDDQGTTVEKKKLSDIDPDSLTDEELEKLDLSEFEAEIDEEEKSEDKEEKKVGELEKEKIADKEIDESSSEDEKQEEEETTGDPLKDTKAALTREQQRRAELERELREMKQRLIKAQTGEFEELTEEELEELKYDDPDAYAQYLIDKHDYEQSREEAEKDIEHERMELQFNEITQFVQKQGIDVNDKENFEKFLQSDKFKQLDKFILNNFKPNAEGLFTSEQMNKAWKMLYADEIIEKKIAEAKIKGVQETVENITRIQKNGGGGSDLDRIKKSDVEKPKSAAELTQEDIDNMTEAELEQYEKELAALERG